MSITRWLIAVLLLVALSACNTVKGFGQDISTAGQALKRSASK